DVRKTRHSEIVAALVARDARIACFVRIVVHLDDATVHVDDPILVDVRMRVEERLRAIDRQGRIRDLDDEVRGARMRVEVVASRSYSASLIGRIISEGKWSSVISITV